MSDLPPFNPDDPFDQLAELARSEIADAGLRILSSPEYKKVTKENAEAVLAGVLTGACGIAMAQFAPSDESHIELRALIAAYLPLAFDQARSIHDLPPLPRADQ